MLKVVIYLQLNFSRENNAPQSKLPTTNLKGTLMIAKVLWEHWLYHLFLFINGILISLLPKQELLQRKPFTICQDLFKLYVRMSSA